MMPKKQLTQRIMFAYSPEYNSFTSRVILPAATQDHEALWLPGLDKNNEAIAKMCPWDEEWFRNLKGVIIGDSSIGLKNTKGSASCVSKHQWYVQDAGLECNAGSFGEY